MLFFNWNETSETRSSFSDVINYWKKKKNDENLAQAALHAHCAAITELNEHVINSLMSLHTAAFCR